MFREVLFVWPACHPVEAGMNGWSDLVRTCWCCTSMFGIVLLRAWWSPWTAHVAFALNLQMLEITRPGLVRQMMWMLAFMLRDHNGSHLQYLWNIGPFLLASFWTIQRSIFWCHEGGSKNFRKFFLGPCKAWPMSFCYVLVWGLFLAYR